MTIIWVHSICQEKSDSAIFLKYQNNLLSADIKSATIKEIFHELKKQTGIHPPTKSNDSSGVSMGENFESSQSDNSSDKGGFGGGINYEIDKEIQGQKVTITLKNKELVQAIKDILNTIGNPSYMLSWRKDKSGKYNVARVRIEKTGKKDLSSEASAKAELKDGEMEVGYINNEYYVRAKQIFANELIEQLANLSNNEKIVLNMDLEKIKKKIDVEGKSKFISTILKYDVFGKIRPKIYEFVPHFAEVDRKGNIIKEGYYEITRLSDKEIHRRREKAIEANKKGESLVKQGNYIEAIRAFERSSGKLDKDYVPPLKNLAKVYILDNRPKDSLGFLSEALEITKKDPEVYELFGKAYQKNNQIDLAIQNYKKSIELEKDEKKKAKLKTILEKLNTKGLKNFYSQMEQGDNYIKQNKIKEAEEAYKKAIEINPENKSAYIQLGQLYRNKRDYNKTIETYEKLQKKHPKDYESYMYLGDAYSYIIEFDKAIEIMNKGKELAPKGSIRDRFEKFIKMYERSKIQLEKTDKKNNQK